MDFIAYSSKLDNRVMQLDSEDASSMILIGLAHLSFQTLPVPLQPQFHCSKESDGMAVRPALSFMAFGTPRLCAEGCVSQLARRAAMAMFG